MNGELGSSLTANEALPTTGVNATANAEPQSAAAPMRELATAASEDAYRIGPADVLEVSVFKVPDLSKTVQVADAGTVNLPLVGEIPVAGKTPREFEHELTQKLGTKYLNSPQVSVYVREYNSQRVTVEGSVKSPGVHPIRGSSTLVRMIAAAGGLADNYDSTIVIFRDANGRRSAARFDIDDIRTGKANDPTLQAGDVVIVGSSFIKNTYNNLLKALPAAGLFVTLL